MVLMSWDAPQLGDSLHSSTVTAHAKILLSQTCSSAVQTPLSAHQLKQQLDTQLPLKFLLFIQRSFTTDSTHLIPWEVWQATLSSKCQTMTSTLATSKCR